MRRLLPCLLLVGCATSGFNTSLYDAAQLNDAAVKTIGSLVQSGALTSTNAEKALTITNSVQAALVLAQSAENAGNQSSATATLTAVTTALTTVTACLTSTNLPNVTACLAGVPAP